MKINPEVTDLSTRLSPFIILDKNGKADEEALKAAFDSTLPDGLTPEICALNNQHESTFRAAVTHDFGTKAIELFKDNPELDKLSLTVPMVEKNKFTVDVWRAKTATNQRNPALPAVTFGATRFSYDVHEASANDGQLKAVREYLAESALAAYGS